MGSYEGRHKRMPPSHAFVTGVCKTKKRGYWTMAGARALAKSLKKQGGKALHAYDCPHCDYFHAGHLSPGVVQGRIAKEDAYPPKEDRAS
jgi:hypothetical protein